MRPPPAVRLSHSPSSKKRKRARTPSGASIELTWMEVTTEVQGFTSEGSRSGTPIMALTRAVLPALTCPIMVTEGSKASISCRMGAVRSRISGPHRPSSSSSTATTRPSPPLTSSSASKPAPMSMPSGTGAPTVAAPAPSQVPESQASEGSAFIRFLPPRGRWFLDHQRTPETGPIFDGAGQKSWPRPRSSASAPRCGGAGGGHPRDPDGEGARAAAPPAPPLPPGRLPPAPQRANRSDMPRRDRYSAWLAGAAPTIKVRCASNER